MPVCTLMRERMWFGWVENWGGSGGVAGEENIIKIHSSLESIFNKKKNFFNCFQYQRGENVFWSPTTLLNLNHDLFDSAALFHLPSWIQMPVTQVLLSLQHGVSWLRLAIPEIQVYDSHIPFPIRQKGECTLIFQPHCLLHSLQYYVRGVSLYI